MKARVGDLYRAGLKPRATNHKAHLRRAPDVRKAKAPISAVNNRIGEPRVFSGLGQNYSVRTGLCSTSNPSSPHELHPRPFISHP
jgi:hypothetical protein